MAHGCWLTLGDALVPAGKQQKDFRRLPWGPGLCSQRLEPSQTGASARASCAAALARLALVFQPPGKPLNPGSAGKRGELPEGANRDLPLLAPQFKALSKKCIKWVRDSPFEFPGPSSA
ncbi:hypothetical protein CB1_000471022 [Camelus ferus]|nr:hypothetical protein CB1_000471022 [Camelus ferus]